MSEWLKEKYSYYFKEGFLIYEGKLEPEELKERLRSRAKMGVIPSLLKIFLM